MNVDLFCTAGISPPHTFRGSYPGEVGPDFIVENHGTLFLLQPLTPRARAWVDQSLVVEPWQFFGRGLAVEHRCIADIVTGIRADGLEVRP